MTCNADSSKCVTQSDKKKETGGKGNGYSGGCGSFHSGYRGKCKWHFKLSESSDQENIWRLVYNGKQQ